jgi:hypothetical protein
MSVIGAGKRFRKEWPMEQRKWILVEKGNGFAGGGGSCGLILGDLFPKRRYFKSHEIIQYKRP